MRRIVLIAIAVFGFLMISVAVVPYFIPTDTYRGWVERQIARDIAVRVEMGKLHLRFIPYPGYTIRNMSLVSTTPPFKGRTVLTAKRVEGDMSLFGLLKGKVVTRIKAYDVKMDYRVEGGVSNLGQMLGWSAGTAKVENGDYSLMLRSVDVIGGALDVFLENEIDPFVISGIDLAVRNPTLVENGDAGMPLKVYGAEIRMNGSMLGSRSPNFSITGKFVYDSSRGEFSAKGVSFYLLGAQMSADVLVNTGISPHVFDIHVATPAVAPSMLAPICPQSVKQMMTDLAWDGTAALDISMKGSKDASDLDVVLDATPSSIKWGEIFSKGVGLPLKISSSFYVSPHAVSIRDLTVNLNQDRMIFKGDIKRDEDFTMDLTIGGDGLNDAVLEAFFPKLAIMDSFEDMKISIDVDGPLLGTESTPKIKGEIRTKDSQIAGIKIADLDGVFLREGDEIIFPSIRGMFADGELSGNGSIKTGEKTEYDFEGVVKQTEIQKIEVLGGMLRGQASLVVKAATSGSESISIEDNLKISGSLLIPSGSFATVKLGEGLFSEETWKGLETLAGAPFDSASKSKMKEISQEFNEMEASYELTSDKLDVTSLSCSSPQYTIEEMGGSVMLEPDNSEGPEAEGTVDGKIHMEGLLIIPKGVARQLVVDVSARKKILDEEERLVLPIMVGGTLKALTFQLDHVKLAKRVEERPLADEPAGKPAKIIRQGTKEESSGRESAKKAGSADDNPKPADRPKGKGIKRQPVEEKRDADEILRIIIGR